MKRRDKIKLFLTVLLCAPVASHAEIFDFTAHATFINSGLAGSVSLTAFVASSIEPGYVAPNAFDGNATTRWGSTASDLQWISVNYGTPRMIDKVTLLWGGAYAKAYKIQVSQDGQAWTDVVSVTNGDGGQDALTFSPVSATFLRVYCTQRATQWGYSIYEINVSYQGTAVSEPTSTGSGATTNWQSAGWYGGGCYPTMTFDPKNSGRVYLVSDVVGIWRSDNNGDNWNFITKGLDNLYVPFVAIAPSDSNILYAATQGGLYKSVNAGGNWTLLNQYNKEIVFMRPDNHHSIAINKTNSNVVTIGTKMGAVLHTTDGGNSWAPLGGNKTPFGNTSPITSLKLSKDGAALYASSNSGGVMKFVFAKNAWTKLTSGPTASKDLWVSAVTGALYAPGGNQLWTSTDGGSTWTKSAKISKGNMTRVVESADGTRIAVVWESGWDGGVFLTANKGASWSLADALTPDLLLDPTRIWARSSGARVTSIAINPFNKNVMMRADWWGIWRSDDGGLTWKEKLAVAPNTVGSDLVVTADDKIFVGAMDNGLLSSADQGKTYQALFPKAFSNSTAGHVWRVAVSANGQNIVGTSSPWNEVVNQIILSADGGKTFTTSRNGLPSTRPKVNTMWGEGLPRAFAVDPNNFNKMYLGIDGDDGGGLFVSQDGGKNWARSSGQPGSKQIYNGLVVDPTNTQRLYWAACGSKGGVYRSQDGGASWQQVLSQMSWVFDMTISPTGIVYAAGDVGGTPRIYVSKDKGATWSLLATLPAKGVAEGISIDPKNSNNIAVGVHQWTNFAGGKVFLSKDAGMTWNDITEDLPYGTGIASSAFSKKDNTLYLLRYAGSVYKKKI